MKYTVDPAIEVPTLTVPGMYPIYYVTTDGGTMCPACVNSNRPLCADPNADAWYVTDTDINYENTELYCEHCNELIESAYGESNPA